jgi:hypothetical protein
MTYEERHTLIGNISRIMQQVIQKPVTTDIRRWVFDAITGIRFPDRGVSPLS